MTVVIGLEYDGKIYIGGDSSSVSGWDVTATSLTKVFRIGEFLIGYAGSFRMGQIVQYHLSVPQQQDGVSDERYMVVEFVEALRQCLKDKGYSKIDNNQETGAYMIVGYKGRVYLIDDDFQVNPFRNGLIAIGSGAHYALGAMAALQTVKPPKRIKRALEITAQFCATVCAPFVVEVQK